MGISHCPKSLISLYFPVWNFLKAPQVARYRQMELPVSKSLLASLRELCRIRRVIFFQFLLLSSDKVSSILQHKRLRFYRLHCLLWTLMPAWLPYHLTDVPFSILVASLIHHTALQDCYLDTMLSQSICKEFPSTINALVVNGRKSRFSPYKHPPQCSWNSASPATAFPLRSLGCRFFLF